MYNASTITESVSSLILNEPIIVDNAPIIPLIMITPIKPPTYIINSHKDDDWLVFELLCEHTDAPIVVANSSHKWQKIIGIMDNELSSGVSSTDAFGFSYHTISENKWLINRKYWSEWGSNETYEMPLDALREIAKHI